MTPTIVRLLFFILVLSLISCSSKQETDSTFELVFEEFLKVPIDSVSKKNHAVSYYSDNLNQLFVFNEFTNSIYAYDIYSGDLKERVALSKDGPDKVLKVQMVYVNSMDSIYLFDGDNSLVVVNDQGKVINKSSVLNRDNGDPVLVNNPTMVISGAEMLTLVRPGLGTDDSKYKSILAYSFEESSNNYFVSFPENYRDGRWGMKAGDVFFTKNEEESKVVLSYAYDPEVHVYSLNSQIVEKFEASSSLMYETKQLDKKTSPYNSGMYMLTNSWYGKILYDKYRKVYYRSGFVGYDMSSGTQRSRNDEGYDFVTIVLDESFNKVGELKGVRLDAYSFVDDEGLFVADYSVDTENEDLMVFARYVLTPINFTNE